MKIKYCIPFIVLGLFAGVHQATAQGTAFTYQGRLNSGGSPASGTYDFRFRLAADPLGGTYVASAYLTNGIAVAGGLFSTTIDFGPGLFAGGIFWLEVDVRTNGAASFTALAPLQAFTPTPYAIFANTASNVSGTLPVSQLSGTVPLAQLPANLVTNNETSVTLGNVTVGGNLTLPVGTASAGIIYAGATPLLINWDANFFAGPGAGNLTTTGIGNTAVGDNALFHNLVGNYNEAIGFDALYKNTIGTRNAANGADALFSNTTGGANTASGCEALYANTSGSNNVANGVNALCANTTGNGNVADGFGALQNCMNDSELVAIGYQALQNDNASNVGTESGFGENTAIGYQSLQGNMNGTRNTAIGFQALQFNTNGAYNTAIGSQALQRNTNGAFNTANGYCALVDNTSGLHNTASGYGALAHNTSGSFNTAFGSHALEASGYYSYLNDGQCGNNNIALGYNAGGNYIAYESGNIDIGNEGVQGDNNIIRIGSSQTNAFIAGNVGIGTVNPPFRLLQVGDSTVPGSQGMIRLGSCTTNTNLYTQRSWDIGVPQTGDNATGMGYSFVIIDATPGGKSGGTNAAFLVQYSTGNVGIGTNNPTHLLQVANAYCDGNTWSPVSDRNLKSGFAPLDAGAVLAKVAALPITRWHYKNDETTPHVGPMAQDFYSAFGVGADDRHIADVDEGGVALAAIQGLNQKMEADSAALRAENAALTKRLGALEQLIGNLKSN